MCTGFIFMKVVILHLQILLRNEHLLRYIFKTPISRTLFFPQRLFGGYWNDMITGWKLLNYYESSKLLVLFSY